MYGLRDFQTERSQWEAYITYDNTYMWNLQKTYKWTYIQSRNRVTDIENKLMVTRGLRRGINWETGIDIYTLNIK